jgi:hypothetical protein
MKSAHLQFHGTQAGTILRLAAPSYEAQSQSVEYPHLAYLNQRTWPSSAKLKPGLY